LDNEALELLKRLREAYARLTDGIARNRTLPSAATFKGDELISDYSELVLVHQYLGLEKLERTAFAALDTELVKFPVFKWLAAQTGVGPMMSAVLLSEIDIHNTPYPSSMWALAGLDVVTSDGLGRSRRQNHLVDRAYTTRKGEASTHKAITFNPFL